MKQFVLSSPVKDGGLARLTGGDYHYLVNVRRLRKGDTLNAIAEGKQISLQVTEIDKNAKEILVTASCVREYSGILQPRIILFQSVPKGTKMDLIVRQAVESGVSEIIPFVSDYSIKRTGLEDGTKQHDRLNRIVREAMQQSGSQMTTIIHPLMEKEKMLELWKTISTPDSVAFFLHPVPPLENSGFHSYLRDGANLIAIAIGPEGGFSPSEETEFLACGFKAVCIGSTILRVETAAICAISAVRVLLLEKDSWRVKE
jgi:16S rRNA (uracil1498-N3)-methyltransferase